MRLLFEGRLAPITTEIGFLEVSAERAVAAFLDWMRPIHEPLGRQFREVRVSGGLEEALLRLLPLVNIIRTRNLFIPTASPWCAYFDNGHQGTDSFSAMSYLAQRLGCRGMRVVAVPDTIEGEFRGAKGHYGAVILEVYGPERTDWLNTVRSISALHDGGRWDFHAGGTPFPFEETERYQARRIRDRFTFDMLERYLKQLGLSPFDEDFYLPGPGAEAVLIERTGLLPPGMREFGLEALR
jgi:hypothetical protein